MKVETYVNDEWDDPNPGIVPDIVGNPGEAMTSEQARALAAELNDRADYFDGVARRRICTAETGHLPGTAHRWQECPTYHEGER